MRERVINGQFLIKQSSSIRCWETQERQGHNRNRVRVNLPSFRLVRIQGNKYFQKYFFLAEVGSKFTDPIVFHGLLRHIIQLYFYLSAGHVNKVLANIFGQIDMFPWHVFHENISFLPHVLSFPYRSYGEDVNIARRLQLDPWSTAWRKDPKDASGI